MKKVSPIASHNNLKAYFDEIRQDNLLTFEEEIELAKRIENNDKNALNKMIKCNLRLVIKIAKRYITPEWELSDLIQEGNIGLMKAVEKYDYRRNVRFSTYASWWIKQSIIRSISNKRRVIRLPHRKEEKLRKINITINIMFQELKRMPSIKELSERLGYSEFDILNLKNISENLVSIDADNSEDGCFIINMLDDEHYSPDNILDREEIKRATEDMLDKLKEKEKEILRQRFALDDSKKETLKSIAKNLGISPETVRQIELKTINKIKVNFPHLRDYLYT